MEPIEPKENKVQIPFSLDFMMETGISEKPVAQEPIVVAKVETTEVKILEPETPIMVLTPKRNLRAPKVKLPVVVKTTKAVKKPAAKQSTKKSTAKLPDENGMFKC